MSNIETLLDGEGRGVLTAELFRLFVANGCYPECHICDRKLKEGDNVHLRPFFVKTTDEDMLTGAVNQLLSGFEEFSYETVVPQSDKEGKTTSSIDVLICRACSAANKPLPKAEADKLLALAHMYEMVEDVEVKAPEMGAITFRQPDYSSFRGVPSRGGGCMVVRKAGVAPKIIGSDSKNFEAVA